MNTLVARFPLVGLLFCLFVAGCFKSSEPAAKGDSADKLLLLGEAKENAGDVAGALAIYQQALKERPNDAALNVHIAQAAYKLNKPERGLQAIARLKTIDFPGKDLAELDKLKATFDAMKGGAVSNNPRSASDPAAALAIATAKAALDDAQAAIQRNDADGATRFAREARAALKQEIAKPDQNDVEFWFQAGRVALALEDDRLAALSFEAIQRLRRNYNDNDALLNLMAKLNRRPIKSFLRKLSKDRVQFLGILETALPCAGQGWTNSLGMRFVPVTGSEVLFCIWETRVQDYTASASANPGVDGSWQNVKCHEVLVSDGPTHPVVNVSWNDARAFCEWLTNKEQEEGHLTEAQHYRLPTDLEWSAAVGLGVESGDRPKERHMKVTGVYPWGGTWPPSQNAGNFADETSGTSFPDRQKKGWIIPGYSDGYATTSPVGFFSVNRYGLYDMGGNVEEWCEDRYDVDESSRVVRGSSWGGFGVALLSSYRGSTCPSCRFDELGFRCVLQVSLSR